MKVSMSLPDDDVNFLDKYAAERGLPSRSAALHQAVRLLRSTGLGAAYEAAWAEWSNEDQTLWDSTAPDGLN